MCESRVREMRLASDCARIHQIGVAGQPFHHPASHMRLMRLIRLIRLRRP